MYRLRKFKYKVKSKAITQFMKHSWLDIKRDKTKIIFGVSGIAISIFLLTTIGYLNDTMGYNYIQSATNTTGSADIMITETIQTDLSYDPYFDESIIDDSLQDIEGVEQFFPRLMMMVQTSSQKTAQNGTLFLYGIDFVAEYENGHMGNLIIVDENGDETDEIYEDEPEAGECVILWNVAGLLNLTRGDNILLEYSGVPDMNVTVVEICKQDQKFMQFETALIIVNLEQAQDFLDREGQINYITGTIKNPERIYDARNLDVTTSRLRVISGRIQERLDINKYTIALPKLSELEGAEFTLMTMTIMFWFIMILSMLITGILINGILSTSIEERVREFGIIRVVGGKKMFPVKMVIFEGFLYGLIGSSIGLFLGWYLTPAIASNIFSMFMLEFSDVTYVIQPETILIAFSIGLLVSLGISLLPAIKTAKIDLIKAVTPFQTKEEGWQIKKEGSVNVRSFVVGIAIATIGLIIFILMPQIFVTGDMMLIAFLFIGLLAAILIGLVFVSVGIVPLIQRLFLAIISPGIRKYSAIIRISLKRYGRRNTSTVVMFAIAFSFIFFVTGMSQMQSDNMSLSLRFQYGSDLVLLNQGSVSDGTAVDLEMYEELKNLEGIEDVAYSLHNTFDITALFSILFDTTSGSSGFGEDSTEQSFMDLIGYYAAEMQTKYRTKIADVVEFDQYDAGFIGVNKSFLDIIDKDLLIWESTGSSTSYSFNKLFANSTDVVTFENNTYNVEPCIIAKSIASNLGIGEVGKLVELTFFDPQGSAEIPVNRTLFRVVGISGGIPGYWNFRSSEMAANGGGVMVSLETYQKFMGTKNPGQENMTIDKIFINLEDTSVDGIEDLKSYINTYYQDKNFVLDDAITKVKFMKEMSERNSLLMEIILMFTVVICIFGLISSMYAIILERTFEIGILRSMGMKTGNVRNMFLIESMLIMLSAGIMGTIIGTFTAYLLQTNMSLLTEMPTIFTVPYLTLFRVFSISIAVGLVGIYVILMRLSRQTIMDIFRQTF